MIFVKITYRFILLFAGIEKVGYMAKNNSPRKLNLRMVILVTVLIALVCFLTIALKIPLAPTKGYMNLSNVGIYWVSFTFSPWISMIAAAAGTGIADAVTGYPQWIIFSMIIHGSQGLDAGLIARAGDYTLKWIFIGWIFGSIVDSGGYFLAMLALYGFGPALVDFPSQIVQQVFAAIISIPLVFVVKKVYPQISQFGKKQKFGET